MISDKDLNRIAKTGQFKSSDEKADLRRFLSGCRRHISILIEYKEDHLAHRQQRRVMQDVADSLDKLIQYSKANPQIQSLLIAGEQRYASRAFRGASLDRALDRVQRQVRRRFGPSGPRQLGQLGRLQDAVTRCVAELESAPLLPVIPSAAKSWHDYLARSILFYLAVSGRLGDTMPTSDDDWRVKFAHEIFNVLLKDSRQFSASHQTDTWTLGAVRRRIAAHFEDAQAFIMRPPDLERERAERDAWRSRAVNAYLMIPHVSEQEAQEFADGLAVDLTVDPRDAVRRDVATWND